ncbi:helix-turn-helix transcriptional regulator [Deinococcus sonorensis]|uniref:Helix-turn-helix transcriptional regulator n=2 Tax=Deinococcus sonorensis TaxID=309891 RepID=A0AAU7UE48_9DEIO
MNPEHPFARAARTVRERRRLLGIHPAELARHMQVSPAVLDALERGDYDPRSLHTVARQMLSHHLNIPLEPLQERSSTAR